MGATAANHVTESRYHRNQEDPVPVFLKVIHLIHLAPYSIDVSRTTRAQSPPAHVTAIEVIRGSPSCWSIASIYSGKTQALSRLLSCDDLRLQSHGALIDGLQLTQVRVEDTDDLRNLWINPRQ